MNSITQRRAGRPSRALLSRERIGEAALDLVDEAGDFTLPELARRLGVQTASLYHHVNGRAGVVELLRERISDQIDSELLMGERWNEALPAFFRSYREVFAAHPKVVPLLATAPIRLPRAIEAYDRMVDLLNGAGVAPERALEILTALESFVIGSALDLAAPDVMWEIPEGVEAPHLAAALTDRGPHAGRAEAAFERGLELLLAAIGQPAGLSVDRLRRGPGRR